MSSIPHPSARAHWRRLLIDHPSLHRAAGSPLATADAPQPPHDPAFLVQLFGSLIADPGALQALRELLNSDKEGHR
jgi:hypothetical protein